MRLALLAGTSAALLLLAGPASAHVTVHGDDAVRGGDDALITFVVPNEESDARTTKVEVTLPTDAPIAGVYAQSKPGWSVSTARVDLKAPIETDDGTISTAVSRVTWTATSGGTGAGQFDAFTVAAGHLPDADALVFKVLQTYSNGATARWIETGDDAEHPAPVLRLTADAAAAPTPAATPTVAAGPTASAAPVATKASEDGTAKALGGAGLAVAVVAALLALGAFLRSGRRTPKG